MFDFSLPVTIVVDFIHEYYMCVATPAAVVGCCASVLMLLAAVVAVRSFGSVIRQIIYDCLLLTASRQSQTKSLLMSARV